MLFRMTTTNKKYGIALLGLGKYASEQLAPALQETKECMLAGVITGSPAKAREWADKYALDEKNVYSYDNMESIKDNPNIDIIYVVVPNALHADFVIRAAKAGKHVICEKPMATTVEDCDRMIEACTQAGVTLSIGYRLHFEPYNLEMMRLATTQHYGPVQKLIAKDGLPDAEGWRLNKQLAGGGPLMDVGIYCVQAAGYIFNQQPIAVTAQEGPKTKPNMFNDIEESVTFQLEYAGGYTASCACSYTEEMSVLRAEASNGFFELQPAFDYNGIHGHASYGPMHFEQVNQQARQMDSIVTAIKNNKPSPVPASMGRRDVVVLQQIYAAMQSGQRVLLNSPGLTPSNNEL